MSTSGQNEQLKASADLTEYAIYARYGTEEVYA